ncbi:antibiotic biosynthesis monooxygenase [Geodermatophilus sp. YIM 151500]|uniref:putative quinol monooxygenase n=1 Tax=Geodermatophilus sp. YIM 151500 TaxID=2984531 RepID=UPI0021E495C4|nr:antibiotic biosynthesis monooxygenase [Geodermatophilus sp. YIM 151500]MCV2488293.1 antibiotic biosynthesis monooxygenase [Geodermatophilus sp. YIM 151500]
MYARSVIVHADPQRIDDGLAYLRDEAMPVVQDTPGCVGMSMLCDRDSGRCIATTAWESEEAMRASAESLRHLRERFADVLGGTMEVQQWEVAGMHRRRPAGEGACTRVTWSRARDASQVDHIIESWKATMPMRLDEMDGFCSVSLMVDRGTARAASAVTYESRDALDRSRSAAQAMRDQFVTAMDVEVTEVAEFELAFAHLRVPEMA